MLLVLKGWALFIGRIAYFVGKYKGNTTKGTIPLAIVCIGKNEGQYI